jgi:polysaccharide pyruvyl transferase WcaK-like protein
MAKYMGLRVMLYGNGIGPITKPRNIAKARGALERCDYISLRDPESYAYVQNIGVRNPNVTVSVDPVFSLYTADGSVPAVGISADIPALSASGYFAVSLRPWKYNDVNFADKITEAIHYTALTYGLTPLLIPMEMEDVNTLKEAAKKLTCDYVLLPRVFRYDEIMSVIARAEFALCMRLHALIYAAGMGLPIIGLVYDPKVANFITYMNEETKVDTSDLDLPALKHMIDKIMENPAAAREKINAERERLVALSHRDAQAAMGLLEGGGYE